MSRSSSPTTATRWPATGVGLLLAAVGLALAGGGAVLIARGGSGYYLVMGLALLASGVQFVRGRTSGLLIYLAAFVGTVIWAFAEVGSDFWALHARIFAFACLLLLAVAVQPWQRRRAALAPRTGLFTGMAGVVALGIAAAVWGMFLPHGIHNTTIASGTVPVTPETAARDWSHYGNGPGGDRFGALDQINRGNVDQLAVAWTFHTGDVPESDGNGAEDQLTPLQIGSTVFVCTPHNNVIAVDADTGAEKWKRVIDAHSKVWMRCRGLAYFDATQALQQPTDPRSSPVLPAVVAAGAPCQRRILMNTITAELMALDADTGEFCADFGDHGRVDLKAGLGDAPDPLYVLTSAPTVAGTTVVVGGRISDNVALDMPGGVMRGFDVITGRLRWAFDPGNPTDKKAPADGKTYTRSTPNVWAPMSYDPALNTVFMPTGSAAIDLWGPKRTAFDHRYGAAMLAVDATTGQERWVYQTVHNDLWDFDVPMQPTFFDFKRPDGSKVPAMVFGTKAGQLYVLDRANGQPLTEVVEKPVKPGNIPNEPYSPTQPLSVGMPQIGAQTLTEASMWGATPFDQLACRIAFKGMRYEGLYTTPDTDTSLSFPGSLGGMNWGGVSIDPTTNTIYVNDMRLGLWVRMTPQQAGAEASDGGEAVNAGMGAVPLKGTPYSVVKDRFMSPLGIPCQQPPFGSLTAVNLDTRKVAWEIPLGTIGDSVLHGLQLRLPIPVGMPTIGGSMTTQGGLVFFAATQDFYLRAFDSGNGRELWKARLPVGSQGTPITYRSPSTGRQYVLISAGGARQSAVRGDYLIAYALPK
ncbi:membrane-bound PQQ-dependent dehydrogenase, glucose/quinate/shikimate family [Xylophilus sp. GOD-11R]|uniref:membrane-bound PQQ-dependent dehydrogenase, glucose/quinate/shikimate family n=1 Tax=Xylophilus sp. GOD-11R TaxID=3089814 RepID=UPI00298CC39A|nr:membrane-bound PQQ-dependent dehydrogenase, glucose/quinate/shikimate family [Xylophilus sp. GOD-11R]WPB55195.1 membrane-bound PQQ-dependent dehydrogenase, glucose/quinate/shikimate family [Xylophilus sp. GOD-11R]